MAGPPPFDPNASTWRQGGMVAAAHAHPSASEQPTLLPAPGTAASAGGSALSTGHPLVESRPLLPVGTVIDGHYRVDGVIGAGAMGVVYRAHHLRLDRPVALKLQRMIGFDGARLEREARAMARLSHPNVVGVYDVGTFEGDLYIAMEFVDGTSLRAWLQAGPRPWRAALEVCLQAGRGLMAAHAAGIVHRDFKPDNVLVGRDGRVRVADFGIARGVASPAPDGSVPAGVLGPDLTRTGSMPGTPAYMAPEQFEGVADVRSDVFAFSVVLYEALWGMRPFAGASLPELLANLAQGRVRHVPRDSPVPHALMQAVRAGLALDPRTRPASMGAMLLALERGARSGRSRTTVAVAVAAGLVLVVAIATVALWSLRRARRAERHEARASEPEGSVREPELALPQRETPAPVVAAPVPVPAPAPAPASREEGLAALRDVMRGREVDPEQLEGVADAEIDELLGATAAGLLLKDAEAHADKGGFVRPRWDGKSELVCGMGDKFLLQGETLSLQGTAFMTMYGCQLHVVDCDITADVIAHVMLRSELTITGGTLRPRKQVLDQLHGAVVIAGATVEGTPTLGLAVGGGTTRIADVRMRAKTAISAHSRAQIRIEGGRIEGTEQAVSATSGARIDVVDAELVGPIDAKSDATVGPPAP